MKIALHDSDKNKFPNLALMKLSYYHKAIGDDVSWWNPIGGINNDKYYCTLQHSRNA